MLNNKQIVIRLIISMILSSLIGMDRESTKKPAGLRTHILVSLGSTLIMLLSIHQNIIFSNMVYYSDRLVAQVVSGIGFLGAGTILRKDSGIVTGLTTAASLWIVAAIGLAVGAGFYLGAILTTILVIIILISFHRVSNRFRLRGYFTLSLSIISVDKPGQVGKIGQLLGDYGANILYIDIEHKEDGLIKINIELAVKELSIKYELLNSISSIDNIIGVSQRS